MVNHQRGARPYEPLPICDGIAGEHQSCGLAGMTATACLEDPHLTLFPLLLLLRAASVLMEFP